MTVRDEACRRQASAEDRFVGRVEELQELEAAAMAAARGRGTLVVVSGEPGIGKTRFCGEAAERAQGAGLKVVTAGCWVHGGAPALWPWQPVLGALCGDEGLELLASERNDTTVGPDRFARFRAVSDRLAATCQRTPVALFVDDVHAADLGTLLLIRFVARSLWQMPLLFVLSRRSQEPGAGTREATLLDEIEHEAVPVVLAPFDRGEMACVLASHGFADLDDGLLGTLHRVTGGNPLFVRQIASLGRPQPGELLPDGVHVAIRRALGRLTPAAQRLMQMSALLGPAETSIADASLVAQTDRVSLLSAAGEARAAGLVDDVGPDRFSFSHELVRSTLANGLDVADRLEGHVRARDLLGGFEEGIPSEQVVRWAAHALAAAPRSETDTRLAVPALREAAASLTASFAYEQAERSLSAAVQLHDQVGLGAPPAGLLVDWAQAALRCGHMAEARRRFDRAATAAGHEGDPLLLAEAALGLGGHWVNEHRDPLERARVLALQQAALAGLPEDQAVLHCRLRTRLAAEAVADGGAVDAVYDALEATRRCDDPVALAEALSLCHHVLLTPEHAHARMALADELVAVASRTGHGLLGLMGLCWRAVDLFHLGDDAAVPALESLRERATALGSQSILYVVAVMDTMLLIRQGRLVEAEEAATRCYQQGEAVGDVDSLGFYGGHILTIRWIQGRQDELVDLATEIAASPRLAPGEFAFRAVGAAFTAHHGHHERARAMLDKIAGDGLASLPPSSTWIVGMLAVVDLAATLGDAGLAREAYGLLLPHADLPTMASVAVLCLGSTERPLGLAALTFGEIDRAVEHLERAVVENQRLANRPLVAISRADLATALARRAPGPDRARAATLLQRAVDEAEAMGMPHRVDAWRAQLHSIERRRRGTRVQRLGTVVRKGRSWHLSVDDRHVAVGDLVGMRYLAELLTHPGQPVPAVALAGGHVLSSEATHDLLDDAARATYAAHARQLTDELAEAEDNNDLGRAEKLRVELDALVDQIETATGLGGRPRSFTHPTERARTAVRKAIRRALDAIDANDHVIADLLRASIVTGTTCSYLPDPDHPVRWKTRPLTEGSDSP